MKKKTNLEKISGWAYNSVWPEKAKFRHLGPLFNDQVYFLALSSLIFAFNFSLFLVFFALVTDDFVGNF